MTLLIVKCEEAYFGTATPRVDGVETRLHEIRFPSAFPAPKYRREVTVVLLRPLAIGRRIRDVNVGLVTGPYSTTYANNKRVPPVLGAFTRE